MFSFIASTILAASAQPNVLFITVDTLRADRLGCYGYGAPTTPHLDVLAAEGLVFDGMLVEEPQTGPSMIAMFTSQVPRVTGTVRNAVPVGDGVPTVAERFQQAGYRTGAVISNENLKRELSNLARGFDTYDDDLPRGLLGLAEREADEVTDIALKRLGDQVGSRPYFYWVHYLDPHSPYDFREAFNPANVDRDTLDRVEDARVSYDSEVAFVDHHIGRLLAAVPKDNTYIVFTADHGESLMEHNYLGHTREIYQTTMHVPLMLRGPGITPGRSQAPARGVDIGPTLLALADLSPLPDVAGVDLLANPPPNDRVRIFETYDGGIPDGDDAREILADRPPSRQGVIVGRWKLLIREGDRDLFHLPNDPGEEHDVSEEYPEKTAELQAILDHWNATTPRNANPTAPLTEDNKDALKALGYLE